ncbi:MAG TPA: choice-of-anchor J domain-containing protein, partial [Ignavibacteriales bacterium]|nr:choice-of-anchor J domain-containing protein [Ignavibacteriales bacterium]
MRKLLTAFLLISSSISFSQENLKFQSSIMGGEKIAALEGYYFESFEGPAFPPAGWRVANIGGHAWGLGDKSYTGKYSAYMPNGIAGELDWLLLPQFSVGNDDSIKFYYRMEYNITFASLCVLVSTRSEFA